MKNTFAKMFTVCAFAGVLGFALTACDDSSSAGGDETETSALSSAEGQEDVSSSSEKSSSSSSVKDTEPAEVSSSSTKENKKSSDSKSSSSVKSGDSSSSTEAPKSYAEAKVMPSGTYACSKYKCFTTEYLNQDFLEAGKYGEILDERDGQVYKTIEICDEENENCQIWMAQNLNYAYTNVPYNYGDYTSDSTSWCYDNAPANCFKYGRLYTWAVAIDSVKLASDADNPQDCGFRKDCDLISVGSATLIQGFCPNGWHLPNGDEWNALFTAVGGRNIAGTKLKSTNGWQENGNGDDAFGFSALPAGRRAYSGDFFNDATRTYLWSSIEGESLGAYSVNLDYHSGLADLGSFYKNHGYSVRCLKDSE